MRLYWKIYSYHKLETLWFVLVLRYLHSRSPTRVRLFFIFVYNFVYIGNNYTYTVYCFPGRKLFGLPEKLTLRLIICDVQLDEMQTVYDLVWTYANEGCWINILSVSRLPSCIFYKGCAIGNISDNHCSTLLMFVNIAAHVSLGQSMFLYRTQVWPEPWRNLFQIHWLHLDRTQ